MAQRFLALILFILLLPIFCVLSVLILVLSGWPILFFQPRIGFKGKPFWIIKFRTMKRTAEVDKQKILKLNEADAPVFKIRNDPRYTKIGKFLSHSGLDELPQIINVVKGEMEFIGPRPLPIAEAEKISNKYKEKRESVKPGIVSAWVFDGYHRLSFDEWMKSDVDYINSKTGSRDCRLFFMGGIKLIKLVVREMLIY